MRHIDPICNLNLSKFYERHVERARAACSKGHGCSGNFPEKVMYEIREQKNSKTVQRTVREALNTHRLARNHIDDCNITRFQKLEPFFSFFSRMTINLQLHKFASNTTVQHRCLASTDVAYMVQDSHLSCEASCFHWWVVFAVTSHIATMNIFDRYVLDIEAHTVPRKRFIQNLMVPFNRLYFNCSTGWSIVTTILGLRMPVSPLPTETVPIPPIL